VVVGKDWTKFGGIYELWICQDEDVKAKVRMLGMPSDIGTFDLGGVHLTGGRVWAGSVILARWLASLCLSGNFISASEKLVLGPGPVLELGSGLGLAGLTLAKLGHKVVLSDREPVILEKLQEHIEVNCTQDKCRVLNLDWAQAGEARLRRILKAQNFSAVMGADVIYSEDQVHLVVPLLRYALPSGGWALFVNARHHRAGISSFVPQLRLAGHEVVEVNIPCGGELQNSLCGHFEPEQEYVAVSVRVSALG
jgi:predicted nicotinamide N-methyase